MRVRAKCNCDFNGTVEAIVWIERKATMRYRLQFDISPTRYVRIGVGFVVSRFRIRFGAFDPLNGNAPVSIS